jgi:ATP-dependent Lon protease
MASELTGRPVRGDIAMTGEITLSGRVLPVGGIKEKVLAARRAGIHEVILPKQNAKNVNEDLTPELRHGLNVHLVSAIDEVLALALQSSSTTAAPVSGRKRKDDEKKVGKKVAKAAGKGARPYQPSSL